MKKTKIIFSEYITDLLSVLLGICKISLRSDIPACWLGVYAQESIPTARTEEDQKKYQHLIGAKIN